MAKSELHLHPRLKTLLGYPEEMPDDEMLSDWRHRTSQVCKPCWELKYCPYGPFVEQSPLLPPIRAEAQAHIEYLEQCIETGTLGKPRKLDEETKELYSEIISSAEENPQVLARAVLHDLLLERQLKDVHAEGRNPVEVFAPPIENIEGYSVPFPLDDERGDPEIEITPELQVAINKKIEDLKKAIETGVEDHTRPLDPARRKMFEEQISSFDPAQYPETIPAEIADMQCNIFGHVCPVVFVGESITETTERRRRGRYLPFQLKMRVVRRDNYTCQVCGKHLRDDEVEFDHVIPHAKGGSAEEHNIRLTCFDCNRSKSDDVDL